MTETDLLFYQKRLHAHTGQQGLANHPHTAAPLITEVLVKAAAAIWSCPKRLKLAVIKKTRQAGQISQSKIFFIR